MDQLRPRFIIFTSLFMAFLSVIFLCDIKNSRDSSFFKEKYVLIIGILSSPDNFEKRLSIRNTWLKLASDISVSYYFVIGEQLCHIHPLDRASAHSCVENSISFQDDPTITNFSTLKRAPVTKFTHSRRLNSIGFGFQNLDDVIIKKVGVLTSFMNHIKNDVTVKLVSSFNKVILASVTIAYNPASVDDLDFILIPVNNITLKKYSEAQILMELTAKNISNLANCEEFEWNTTPGVINYVQLIQAGFKKPWPFHINSCSFVLMNYEIADFDGFKAHDQQKHERKRVWESNQKTLITQLNNESKHFGDIAFVNVVDVYRNLPEKLIHFFKRLTDTEQFDWVLKTDDDSFIDLLRVFKQVSAVKDIDKKIGDSTNSQWKDFTGDTSDLWWWSNFREFWKVQEAGKWREDKYRSPAYPSFPCGGGYVLSRGAVTYLSVNHKNLEYFQGEDVSIGIWLSGVKIQYLVPNIHEHNLIQKNVITKYVGEKEWIKFKNFNSNKLAPDICDWTCDRETDHQIPLCNRVQLSPSDMYETWDDYIRRGFIR